MTSSFYASHLVLPTRWGQRDYKLHIIYNDYHTPCEKLLSFENVEKYLKPGITRETLTRDQMAQSHLAAAKEMQEAKHRLFTKIKNQMVH